MSQTVVAERFLDAPGAGGSNALVALVDAECLPKTAQAVVGVAVLQVTLAESFQDTRFEEHNLTLTSQAPGSVTRVGRRLNGVYVRAPRRAAAADRQMTLV